MSKKTFFVIAVLLCMSLVSHAAIVEFTGQSGNPTVGGVETASNWAGGVVPFGGDVGRIANAVNVWSGGILQNNAVRLEGGNFFAPLGLAMRGGTTGAGTTLLEVDTTDWAGTTNVSITGALVFWSQFGEAMNLNVLNGSVDAATLNMVAGGKGTINIGNGVIHAGLWENAQGAINMLAGGTGVIVTDTLKAGMYFDQFSLNFESTNAGSFMIGEIAGGTTAAGTWEALIAAGKVSIDGVVTTNAAYFSISDSGTTTTITLHIGALPGLTVVGGNLYKDGAVYRAVGTNYCDLFQAMINFPEYMGQTEYRTLKGLRFLGEQGIPFVRFWACGFWPVDWDLYFQDKNQWFSRMDMLVATAEDVNVGLIPSLFWRTQTISELMGEYSDQWGNPNSLTRQFMVNYIQEVVARYKDSPAIWGWEFANEMNLSCDLPNWDSFLGTEIPQLGVVGPATEVNIRNKMTYVIAESAFNAFSQEVRKQDTHRFVTTGNSNARVYAWHNRMENSWTTDTYSQAKEAFSWMAPPSSINMASVHIYPGTGGMPDYAGASGTLNILLRYREFCDSQNQAMFVGEYSSFYGDAGNLDVQRASEDVLLAAIAASGADLAANWVFDYSYNLTTPGIIRQNNDYTWVLDKVRQYDAEVRGEVPHSLSGIPLTWFDMYGIAPTGNMTLADVEGQDTDGDGLTNAQEYVNGTNPSIFNMSTGELGVVDFANFAVQWLDTNCGLCLGADLSGDGNVTIDDLALLAQNWLGGI